MRIEIEIPAQLRKQVAADFFLPILERGEFVAKVQPAVTAFAFIAHELAIYLPEPRQLLYTTLELPTLHVLILGQICPMVKP